MLTNANAKSRSTRTNGIFHFSRILDERTESQKYASFGGVEIAATP